MILIRSLRPVTSLNSEDTSFGEHLPKGTNLLLIPLSRDPRIREEIIGRFLHKNKSSSSERSSPFCLKHASKEAKPTPPFSAHLRENDEILKKPSQTTSMPQTPDRLLQNKQKGNEIASASVTARECFSFLVHAIRKGGLQASRSNRTEQAGDQTTKSS